MAVGIANHCQRVRTLGHPQLLGFDLAPGKNREPVSARQLEQWQLYATTNSSEISNATALHAQRPFSTDDTLERSWASPPRVPCTDTYGNRTAPDDTTQAPVRLREAQTSVGRTSQRPCMGGSKPPGKVGSTPTPLMPRAGNVLRTIGTPGPCQSACKYALSMVTGRRTNNSLRGVEFLGLSSSRAPR